MRFFLANIEAFHTLVLLHSVPHLQSHSNAVLSQLNSTLSAQKRLTGPSIATSLRLTVRKNAAHLLLGHA